MGRMSPGVELLRGVMGIWFFIGKPVNAEIAVKAGGTWSLGHGK
jgi:hypothetical protein